MLQRPRIFLVVLLLMFSIKNFGQNIPQKIYNGITIQEFLTHIKPKKLFLNAENSESRLLFIPKTCYIDKENRAVSLKHFKTSYFSNLIIANEGIVCRAEYKFQQTTHVPLRLRLGSLDYTNYLEQKPNALKPN